MLFLAVVPYFDFRSSLMCSRRTWQSQALLTAVAGDYRFLGEADAMAKKWEEGREAREAKLDGLQERLACA
ncbi:MAG: hypothetical protein L0K67_01815, partial [Brevibacterium sp.]|nr:hypothetical protein [Brevibacterium sp.]